MDDHKYDFSGWATRNNLKCSDGRIIKQNAFKDNDGKTVPLVYNHLHSDPLAIIGHADLENREEGVYAYCSLNNTDAGRAIKEAVSHGDVSSLSIYANQLVQQGPNVLHGAIREVSVVLAGANPGAFIESVIKHGMESDEEAIIYTGEDISLYHADDDPEPDATVEVQQEPKIEEALEHADNNSNSSSSNSSDDSEETVADVINSMSEKQKTVMYALVGQALENNGAANNEDDSEGGNDDMKHNVFDNTEEKEELTLSHSEMMSAIGDISRYGSLNEAFLAHGIHEVETLFPEPKSLNTPPEFIKRDTSWVSEVMGAVHHTPFSRIKSMFADITEDEARAKGYIKGEYKKEEFFSLLKRTTTPQTVYKKQKMDRDDILDITDFDVIAWLQGEMREMLNEEIARAILIGDGRLASDDDKISEDHIRPIWKDADLFTIQAPFEVDTSTEDENDIAKRFIRTAIKARKDYKGSGNPVLFTTEDMLTDMLLLEDNIGRPLYESEAQLATKMRVRKIVTVEVMENATREVNSTTRTLLGLIVNLNDYNVGTDRGGQVTMFDGFDIDYNQQKYLMETRCSGALTKPYSAIAIESFPKA